jgi:hypothetical protein
MAFCRSLDRSGEQAGRWHIARFVNRGMQKSAVNPLTRIASRSVMRASYSVAAR